jgi:glucose uptake protein GlcU
LVFGGFDNAMTFPQSVGFLISSLVNLLFIERKTNLIKLMKEKKTYHYILVGSIQGIYNVALILSLSFGDIGGSVISPLAQLSTIVATLMGMYYLKEERKYPYNLITLVGCGLIAVGMIMACMHNVYFPKPDDSVSASIVSQHFKLLQ